VLCKNIDVHKLAPRKSQYLITAGDRGQSIMLKYALNVRDLALSMCIGWSIVQNTVGVDLISTTWLGIMRPEVVL
jgi:hypothetical protein